MSNSTASVPSSQPKARQTKAGSIRRTIHCTAAPDGRVTASVAEVLERKREPKADCNYYFLRRIESQLGGIAVEVRKWGENGEVYHVLLNAPHVGTTCDCEWGTYKPNAKYCRHVEICLEAARLNLLPEPPIIVIELEPDEECGHHAVVFQGEKTLYITNSYPTVQEAEGSARLWLRWRHKGEIVIR